jgi:hypothetical protein
MVEVVVLPLPRAATTSVRSSALPSAASARAISVAASGTEGAEAQPASVSAAKAAGSRNRVRAGRLIMAWSPGRSSSRQGSHRAGPRATGKLQGRRRE